MSFSENIVVSLVRKSCRLHKNLSFDQRGPRVLSVTDLRLLSRLTYKTRREIRGSRGLVDRTNFPSLYEMVSFRVRNILLIYCLVAEEFPKKNDENLDNFLCDVLNKKKKKRLKLEKLKSVYFF